MLMCLTFSFNAFAQEEISDGQREAVSLLNDLKIFTDITEEKATDTITRADFAKILVNVLGVGDELFEEPKRIYTDVPADHEAAASIEYLYNKGIMMGYANGEFKPDAVITLNETVKTMVSVMGYSEWAEAAGGYPEGYYQTAMSNKMLIGVSGIRSEGITYADTAVIIQNILESKNYRITSGYKQGYPVTESSGDKEYMSYVLNIYKYEGIFEGCGDTSLYDTTVSYKSDMCKIGNEIFDANGIDVSVYLGMKIKVYYKEDDSGYHIIHITPDKNNSVIDAESDNISDKSTKSIFRYEENGKAKNAQIASNAIYIYNGKRLAVAADEDIIPENGFVRLVSNDGDSEYDIVIIKEYETFIVDKAVITDKILKFKYDKGELDLDDDTGIKAVYYTEGEECEFSSISNGSVISIALSRNLTGDILAEVLISNNKITGTAKGIGNDGDTRKVILDDDSEYVFTKEYMKRLEEGEANTYEPALNNEGTFYIDYFGKLAAYTVSSSGKNYAYVVRCYYDEDTQEGYVRLFTKEGEFKTFAMSDKIKVNGVKKDRGDVPNILKQSGENGTINQLIIFKEGANDTILEIKTAADKTSALYYIATDEEFVLNSFPKNDAGEPCGVRFYKNMAENRPYSFVDGKTIQFMIPTDKFDEKSYKVATKLSSTDVSLPAPLHIYDAGPAGSIGAITTNTASEGKYGTPNIVDKLITSVDEDGNIGTEIKFVGGSSVMVGPEVIYDQPATKDSKGNINWRSRVPEYINYTAKDLKRGDVIEYTTSNGKAEMIRIVVKSDNIGPVRIDGDHMQLNGNMVADVLSVSDNGRTAMVYYVDRFGNERYQTMLVNGTVYRYESEEDKVYNSSTADMRPGDRVLINSYWWSPKVIVIFR